MMKSQAHILCRIFSPKAAAKNSHSKRYKAPFIDRLEPRILLSADFPGIETLGVDGSEDIDAGQFLTNLRSTAQDFIEEPIEQLRTTNDSGEHDSLRKVDELAGFTLPALRFDSSWNDFLNQRSDNYPQETNLNTDTITDAAPAESQSDVSQPNIHELIVIDLSTPDYQLLIDSLSTRPNVQYQIHILDAEQDGIEQISRLLAQYDDLQALHIISHGENGAIALGNSSIGSEDLIDQELQVRSWQNSFADEADILLYGCDIAGSQDGEQFVQQLSRLTNTDVASSSDLSGHQSLGGDWDLEYRTGDIESAQVLVDDALDDWVDTLAVTVNNTTGTFGTGSSNLTFTHTTSGVDRLMLVGVVVDSDDGEAVTSITYNGVAFTHIGSREDNLNEVTIEIWQLVAPDTGTHNVVVNFNIPTRDGAIASATSFSGVDQSNPLGTFASTSGNNTYSASLNVASSVGDTIFSVVGMRDFFNESFSPGVNQTELWEYDYDEVNGAGSIKTATSTSENVSWTFSDNSPWALGAVAVKAHVNQAPSITSDGGGATASVPVNENQTAVTTVAATDPDAGTSIGFSVSGGTDASAFTINGSTGELTFNSAPDFETKSSYEVEVTASDGSLTDVQTLTVSIDNVNEAPVITSNGGSAAGSVSVDENQTAVTTVVATDVDAGAALGYSISGGTNSAAFSINSSTGELTFTTAPDFETKNSYEVQVRVSDGVLTDIQTLTVTIDNVNEEPVITSNGGGATGTVSVNENQTAVTTVAATDLDAGASLTYSVTGGADSAAFSINSSTGELSFTSAPDFETKNSYEVEITVSDGTLTDVQTLTVTIDNVNEAPVITSNGGGATGSVSVDENQTAVTTVAATDLDAGATLGYSVSGGADSAAFSINSTTGELTFTSAPDFETKNSYEVEITVNDGVLTDIQTLTVTIDNVNEAPVITSDGAGATGSVSVDENQTAVTTVAATDLDAGATLGFSVSGGADSAAFSINSSTGELTFTSAPDFETKNSYEVEITVSDGTLTDVQTLTVTIDNVNEAPVITSDGGGTTGSVSVDENQTAVTTVAATDLDAGATLGFSVSGGADSAAFSINSSTGELTFTSAPDFETKNSYQVEITVSDGTLTDVQTLTVTIDNVNEAPVITSNGGGATGTVSVDENQIAVTTVAATDPDTGASLTYAVSGGADSAAFTINSSTGELTFTTAPDFETKNSYEVQVTVSDGTLTDVQTLTVTIDNVNEAPVITSNGGGATGSVSVDENQTAVTNVAATDFDAGASLTYAVSGGTDSATFSIDNITGELTFTSAPDFETKNSYEVEITVSDGSLTDVQTLTVTIDNVNEAPVITSNGGGATGSVSVDENQTAVTTVAATDLDAGATLGFSVSGGADSAAFSINSSTGELTFTSAPDFETKNSYEVEITVSDGVLTDIQTLTVTIDNVNEAPVITSNGGGATGSVSIDENQTAVTTVAATDLDAGATLGFSVSGGADSAAFSINSSTGELTFTSAPDFETKNSYEVEITVSDGVLTDIQTLTVTIDNVNETPVITSDGAGATGSVSVDENQTAVTTVAATDLDAGATLGFSVSGGADSAAFSINSSTGELTFTSAPDFETKNSYEVEITVSDGTLTDVQTLTVTIDNVNEAPVITSNGGGATGSVSVDENQTAVTTVAATDLDAGATLGFSVSGGADSAAFSINSSTGELTFTSAPDFETKNSYEVEITVSDGTLTDVQTLTVTIDNVNEAPVITSDGGGATGSVSVDENQTAVTTVAATDLDAGATLGFSVSGGADSAAFSINSSTGELTFTSAPDFETKNSYEVEITVSDGTLTDVQTLTVTIDNVNEAPVITSNGGGATGSVSVDENQTAVTTVAATDLDAGATLGFSVSGGADSAAFSINSSTGELTFTSAPDFETKNSYEVEITVSDGTLTDVQTLTVTIDNVNEAPVITSNGGGATGSVSVDENQTAVTNVAATDFDAGASLTYAVSGGTDSATFSIDNITGELTFTSAPDFETKNSYEVEITVSDGTLTDVQTLTVTIDNVNEAPVITSNGSGATGTVSVDENQIAVTTVAATDPDAGASLTYAVSGGTDSTAFTINSSTGELTFTTAPDFETKNSYEVQVTVSDGVLTDVQTLTVTIDNVNEAPVITSNGGGTTGTVSVDENQTAVTTVAATDLDAGATLGYSVSGGADTAAFSINSTTGELTFTSAPDFETKNSYEVEITVSDGTLTDVQTLTVTIDNVNEAPVITSNGSGATGTVSVDENQTAVTNVAATDFDAGASLTYAVSGGTDSATFSIDNITGELTFTSAPDFETKNSYEVEITVSDGTLTDVQTLTVTIDNVNEAPVITSNGSGATGTVSVDENQIAVTTVAATDPDAGASLTYAVSGGTDSTAFTINSSTGELTFTTAPDFETKNSYEVQVTVSDGVLTDVQTLTVTIDNVNEAPVITSNGGGTTGTVSVDENQTAVTTVAATDLDAGATLGFSVSGGADSAAFSINSSTGELTFTSAPDFETKNSYEVEITVSDGTLTDVQTLSVTIDNVSEAPVITSDGGGATGSVSVDENQTAVTNVAATDFDAGASLTYAVSGGTDSATFSIDNITGELTFTSAPDFETKNSYGVEITVSDGTLTDVQTLTVTIDNVNEAPVITSNGSGATGTVSVDENQIAVTTVAATDPDAGASLTYAVSGGTDSAAFTINSSTGELTFTTAPDFETKNSYEIQVTVSDGTLTDVQTLTVTIDNVNEAPVITSNGGGATGSVSVDENQTAVTTVAATDLDAGATLGFSVSGGADSAAFSINSSTGELTFTSAPDFETKNSYEVEITVSDGTLTDVQTLTVTIDNVNEAPVITSNGGGATGAVSVDENQTAVTTVAATDLDADSTLGYNVSGGADSAAFSINNSTGELTFTSAPDFETKNSYEVEITVSDGVLTDVQTLTATIDNVNEAPVITSNGGGATGTLSVNENQTAVTTVAATDLDTSATFVYSVSGGVDSAAFYINSSTGELTFTTAPDFETKNSYEVEITVSDGVLTDVQTLTVTIDNVNETPVIISNGGDETATLVVNENQTFVTTVRSTDQDANGETTYSVSGGVDLGEVIIDANSGDLSFLVPANFEKPNDSNQDGVYEVEVTATDESGASDTQLVSINIADVNEAPVSISYTVLEPSTTSSSTTTLLLNNIDLDSDGNSFYEIVGGEDAAHFSLSGENGDHLIFDPLNLNNTEKLNYSVLLQVTDSAGSVLVQEITLELEQTKNASPEQPAKEVPGSPASALPNNTSENLDNRSNLIEPIDIQHRIADFPGNIQAEIPELNETNNFKSLDTIKVQDLFIGQEPINENLLFDILNPPPQSEGAISDNTNAEDIAPQLSINKLLMSWASNEQNEISEMLDEIKKNLYKDLDELGDQLTDIWKQDETRAKLSYEILTGFCLTASTLFLLKILQTGTLLSGFLTTMPMWRQLDPLPILKSDNNDTPEYQDKNNTLISEEVEQLDELIQLAEEKAVKQRRA